LNPNRSLKADRKETGEMGNDSLEKLVEQKIAAGEITPEWIMASVAMQMLPVLRSIDERLETINSALCPTVKGHSIANDITYELVTLRLMLQRAFKIDNRVLMSDIEAIKRNY
jgi:hypothetical protein